ncbi:MAG: sulfite exporter TauE/SafE family protein [Planctomycetota bacterium]
MSVAVLAGLIPDQIENLTVFLIIGSVSALVFSMAKSGFGGGLGLLAVPLMIYACAGNTQFALGLMLPLLIAADYVAVLSWWRTWQWKIVLRLLPGSAVGIAAAWASILLLRNTLGHTGHETTDAVLKIGVGAIALLFVTLRLIRYLRKAELVFRPVTWQTLLAGTSAGYTSTLAHAAGPIATMYLLPQPISKQQFVATSALFFWTVNQLKLIPYFHLGNIRTETFGALVLLIPAIIVGALLGSFLHKRLKTTQFTGVIYTLLTVAGVDLIGKGITALAAS